VDDDIVRVAHHLGGDMSDVTGLRQIDDVEEDFSAFADLPDRDDLPSDEDIDGP
jgi:hypothetical protein